MFGQLERRSGDDRGHLVEDLIERDHVGPFGDWDGENGIGNAIGALDCVIALFLRS